MERMKFFYSLFAVLLVQNASAWHVPRGFMMPEFENLDTDLYPYEDITFHDIWEYEIVFK